MARNNKYYVLEFPYDGIQNIIRHSVGLFENQRASIAGDKIVIKMPNGFKKELPELKKYKQYNHKEILELMNNPEWSEQT